MLYKRGEVSDSNSNVHLKNVGFRGRCEETEASCVITCVSLCRE